MNKPKFSDKQLKWLKSILMVRCCHITGTHDPCHFEDKKYVCSRQRENSFKRLWINLDFGDFPTPEEAVSDSSCYWCNRKLTVPNGEN